MKKGMLLILTIVFSTVLPAQEGLNVGNRAPDFSAKDQTGTIVSLKNSLQKGKVLVVFYRGYWCPNCMRAMKSIQDSLTLLSAQKITVIAVSPETKEGVAKTVKIANAKFPVISDDELKILQAYKVAFTITPEMDAIHKQYNIDVAGNNGKNKNILPRPAAFLIDETGNIIYRYFNTDPYSNPNSNNRITVKEILEKVK